jgi:hypothetical protein
MRGIARSFTAPEVSANVNKTEMGNLRLTPAEEADIVAFMKTLTDGFEPSFPGIRNHQSPKQKTNFANEHGKGKKAGH